METAERPNGCASGPRKGLQTRHAVIQRLRERARMGPDDLIDYWSALDGQTVHPDDSMVLPSGPFAIGLQPLPWNGPLRNARVYVLLLNPGLDDRDYEYEQRREFREALRQNLLGRGPYLYLINRF